MFQCLGKGLLSLVSPCLMGQSFHYSIITSTQNRSVNSQNTLFSLTDSIALSEGYNKLYKAVIVWFSPVYANPRPLYPSPSIFISCSLSRSLSLAHNDLCDIIVESCRCLSVAFELHTICP